MAGANQQITSLYSKEEDKVNEVTQVEEEDDEEEVQQQAEEEDVVRKEEEGDEEDKEVHQVEEEDEEEDEEDREEEEEDDEYEKVDEEDEIQDEEDDSEDEKEDEEYEIGDEEEDTCVYDEYKAVDFSEDMLSKDYPEDYRIYLRYAIKTEGFYVPFAPKDAFGVFTPTGPSSTWWPKAVQGAKLAVAHYNKRRAGPDGQLKFLSMRLLNLRSVGGMLFYITLAAETVASGETNDYQTKVWRGVKGNWEVLIFRKDPEITSEMVQEDKALFESLFPGVDVF